MEQWKHRYKHKSMFAPILSKSYRDICIMLCCKQGQELHLVKPDLLLTLPTAIVVPLVFVLYGKKQRKEEIFLALSEHVYDYYLVIKSRNGPRYDFRAWSHSLSIKHNPDI